MNDYIFDIIEKTNEITLESELYTQFEIMDVYFKEAAMIEYCDVDIIYQESKKDKEPGRSFKDMWKSDTDPIKGRKKEGTFMKIIKFLPRVIRNAIKWIIKHVSNLFKHKKKRKKNHDKIKNHKPSKKAKEKFKKDVDEKKKEKAKDVPVSDPTEPETSQTVQQPDATTEPKTRKKRKKKGSDADRETQLQNARDKYDDALGSLIAIVKKHNANFNADELYNSVYVDKKTPSVIKLEFMRDTTDILSGACDNMKKLVNALGQKAGKIATLPESTINGIQNQLMTANTSLQKFKKTYNSDKDANTGSLWMYTEEMYNGILGDKYVKTLENTTNAMQQIITDLESEDGIMKQQNSVYGRIATTRAREVLDSMSEDDVNNFGTATDSKGNIVDGSLADTRKKMQKYKKKDDEDKKNELAFKISNKKENSGALYTAMHSNSAYAAPSDSGKLLASVTQFTSLLKGAVSDIGYFNKCLIENDALLSDLAIICDELNKAWTESEGTVQDPGISAFSNKQPTMT